VTDAAPVRSAPRRELDARAVDVAGVSAARVYSDPVTIGEHVLVTAGVFTGVGDRQPARGRSIAVVTAGPNGVRIRPIFDGAKLAGVAFAAAAVVFFASRR
jgi:hypothetical protein